MDFVEGGVACRDGKSGEGPSPTPADTRSTDGAKKQNIENEIFGEVRCFTDVMVDGLELIGGQRAEQPVNNWHDDPARVIGRKGICGQGENTTSPNDGRPPGAYPRGNERDALTEFIEFGGGAWISPWLFGQEELLHTIVWGFARDDDVVDVRFAETRSRDANELRFLSEILQR